jgi:DNA modification methylase
MNLIDVDINKLIPYANNPRKNDGAVDPVANSIREFGFKVPIVIDKENNVVCGHTRLKAAKKLGLKTVPCVIADDLNDEQIKAFRLADNKVGELAEWDFDLLGEELDGIFDIDMSDFGFDLNFDDDKTTEEIVEDEVPEEVETRCKIGDLWQLGDHKLICGDSTDVAVIDRLMDGVKANMVFTDPPYGYNYQSNMRTKSEKFDVLENDDKILNFFPNLLGRVKGFVMICTTWKVLDKWLPLFKQYFELSNMVIWDKGGGGIGDLKHTFSTDYEVILCANNGEEIREKRIGSVWSIGKDNANDYEHPTQKPVELSANAIRHTTDKQQIVLDCFGGSGSTLIACEQLNRKCYMVELDPKYVSVILQRYINFKGSDADVFLIKDGKKIPYTEIAGH